MEEDISSRVQMNISSTYEHTRHAGGFCCGYTNLMASVQMVSLLLKMWSSSQRPVGRNNIDPPVDLCNLHLLKDLSAQRDLGQCFD